MNKELENKIIERLEKYPKQSIYTDYRDFEDLDYLVLECETANEFVEKILDSYIESEYYIHDEIFSELLNEFNVDIEDQEYLMDLIRDYIEIEYPIDEFLNQEVKINILTNHYNDVNTDFTSNGWLRWLMNSQGYKLSDYPMLKAYGEYRYLKPCKDNPCYYDPVKNDWNENELNKYNKDNKFIYSLKQEIYNMPIDYMRTMVFLTKITIGDYYKLKENNFKYITLDKNTMCGLFNCWSGTGSILEIELEKDIKINKDNIYEIQLESVHNKNCCTVDSVYGLIGSCWQDSCKIY